MCGEVRGGTFRCDQCKTCGTDTEDTRDTFCSTSFRCSDRESAIFVDSSHDDYTQSHSAPKDENSNIPIIELSPQTPSTYITSLEDAYSKELEDFCMSHPICVVRGLPSVCDLRLDLFSSKTLMETDPDHPLEIRTQHFKNFEDNIDADGNKSWDCFSTRGSSTIKKYAEYQALTYMEAEMKQTAKRKLEWGDNGELENEDLHIQPSPSSLPKRVLSPKRTLSTNHGHKKFSGTSLIKFGTNLDLSDAKKWSAQLKELDKLPSLFQVKGKNDMLSFIPEVLGMNTVQLYMKVKGSRTPGHQENNNFSAVNINIGPGDCEWFGVPNEYWEQVYRLCGSKGIDYLKGSWWPDVEELRKHGIPVYRFLQRPHDLVYINIGCVHWVQSRGWANCIAWNVAPITHSQYKAALDRYAFNKIEKFKSIVPVVNLSWKLATRVSIVDLSFYNLLRDVLRSSLIHIIQTLKIVKTLYRPVRFYGRTGDDTSHYCQECEEEVFNTLMIKEEEVLHHVYCIRCALQSAPELKGWVCLEELNLKELVNAFKTFKLSSS